MFFIGEVVRVKAYFRNYETKVLVDPSTVTIKVVEPDKTISTFVYGTDAELTKVASGIYSLEFPTTQSGVHFYRVESTGTGQSAMESHFEVAPTIIPTI